MPDPTPRTADPDPSGRAGADGSAPSTLVLWLRLAPLHLLAVVAVVACVIGGLWQLGAYESRQGDAVADAQRADAVPVDDTWGVGQPFTTDLQSRVVTATGSFAPADEQLWVRGPSTDGRAWLVAPFVVDGTPDAALLVVRGSADEPGVLPQVPSGPVTLDLSLQPSQGGGAPLDPERRTTAITVPSLLNELPYRLWSGYGLVADAAPAGLVEVAPPNPDVSWTVGLKNLAYAFQWWVFALFAVFMWWRMCTDQVADARARATAPLDEKEPV